MPTFGDIKPGVRLRGLDPAGTAEVVQVARFGPNALNLQSGLRASDQSVFLSLFRLNDLRGVQVV
jgi:hypothetical protein